MLMSDWSSDVCSSDLLARLLDPCGRVDRVSEIDDLALVVAAFAGDDRPAVQTGAKPGNQAELLLIERSLERHSIANGEVAVQAPGIPDRTAQRPGHDHRVARIPVGLAPVARRPPRPVQIGSRRGRESGG